MSPERKRKRGDGGTPLPTHLDNQEGYDPFAWRGISDLKGERAIEKMNDLKKKNDFDFK